jgi:EAL domain-containing protein (putative c-di-GMP-specific phosphodiesterase class I)
VLDPTTPRPAHQNDSVLRVLGLARRHLGVEAAWLVSLRGEEQVFTHVDAGAARVAPRPGEVRELAGSYCARVLDGRLPPVVADTGAEPVTRQLPVTRELGIGAYVGVPVRNATGEVIGMLCCASSVARPELEHADLTVLELLAGVVAELTRDHAQAAALEGVRDRTTGAISGLGRRLVLQPIVDVLAGVATGVEALSRFDTGHGPEVWFSQAEPVGLRLPLELAAARSALAALDRPGHVGYLSLNLSAEAILSDGFPGLLAAVDPRAVVVEITEHIPVDDYEALAGALERHRAAGLRVAVDDAGAGYASLRHILKLEPDFIKIDLSLVRDIHLDPARQALVTALVTFAGTVGAVLVAEGVEAQAELDMLVGLGVRHMQGFLLCPPCADPPAAGFARPSRLLRTERGAIPA